MFITLFCRQFFIRTYRCSAHCGRTVLNCAFLWVSGSKSCADKHRDKWSMNFKCSALNLSGVSLGENRPHAALQLIHSGSNSNIHKPFDSRHPTDFKHIYKNGKRLLYLQSLYIVCQIEALDSKSWWKQFLMETYCSDVFAKRKFVAWHFDPGKKLTTLTKGQYK